MEIRNATPQDRPALRDVARRSLQSSYPLEPSAITGAIEEWYDENRLRERLRNDDNLLLVVDVDGQVVAFADAKRTSEDAAELHWLHVDPAARGRGIGVQLLGRAQETFADRGAERLRGLVLAENEAGTRFYEDHGFERSEAADARIGDRTLDEYVYEKPIDEGAAEAVVEAIEGPEGRDLFVNFSEAERGVRAPFYSVYGTRDLADRHGWFCGDCETTDNAMDSMGRIVCNECGNKRKATRWDASYL